MEKDVPNEQNVIIPDPSFDVCDMMSFEVAFPEKMQNQQNYKEIKELQEFNESADDTKTIQLFNYHFQQRHFPKPVLSHFSVFVFI